MWWPFSGYPERRPEEIDSHEYDYIVVGGGTSGCVLASRLSEDPNVSVLVLERGVANDTWMSRVPLASSDILSSAYGSVHWECEPMRHCNNRRSPIFRGEVLGGASRINACLYTRGCVADYDAWSAMGHPDWSYEKVLPYFLKAENTLNQPKSSYRGISGPWTNQTFPYSTWPFKAYQQVHKCAEAMGFSVVADCNSPEAPTNSIVTTDATIDQNKQRVSTLDGFLPRDIALKRVKNLAVCTGVIVSRIAFARDQTGHRAEKVMFQYSDLNKSTKQFSAVVKREVIVCSGAIGSPQVLMLSGIGPREHLKEHGIELIRDLPGVGSELTDHMGIPVAWEVPVKESLAYVATSALQGAIEFFKYIFFRTGLLAMPIMVVSLFVRAASLNDETSNLMTSPPSAPNRSKLSTDLRSQNFIPDIEIMPLPTAAMDDMDEHKRLFAKMGIFSLLVALLQPKSRGTVRLASSDPRERPKVDFGILSNPADYAIARKAVRLALRLGDDMKALGFPLLQGISIPTSAKDDEELDKFIRLRGRTTYHYASTCRMAPEFDAQAPGVVDDALRVHGVQNLRVCDASVFPQIISSHLQAPVVMVAEKCADMIKS